MKTKKNIIRLTENELKKVISESVKRILKEDFEGKEYGFSQNLDNTPDWKRRDYERMEQQMQDYNDEMTNAQVQHSQGKKPRLSQQTRDFLAQDKTVQGKRKEPQPTLNKFQQRHKENLRKKSNSEYNVEIDKQKEYLSRITDEEIETIGYLYLFDIIDYMFAIGKDTKIISKNIWENDEGFPCMVSSMIFYAYTNKDIQTSTEYTDWSISTLSEQDSYYDEYFAEEGGPNTRQYLVTVEISADYLKTVRQNQHNEYQAEWDEEDRIYGHDNFDDM